MDFAKNALIKSYGVVYLAIGAAIYEVLFVFYSYPNNDTETVTFDRPIQASYCWLASYPGSLGGGEKRAWEPLHAHASILPTKPGKRSGGGRLMFYLPSKLGTVSWV